MWYNQGDMKRSWFLPLARFTSSLSLFGILLCIHIIFTLAHFLPSGSKGAMDAVYIFFFAGSALGAVLCPLFLPLPCGKNKALPLSIGFIAVLIALEFILRSFGFRIWLGSAAVRGIMAFPEGILTTACYGLFYLTWLQTPAAPPKTGGSQANRTGKFCSLVLGAALLGSVLACYYSIPLMEKGVAAYDPLKGGALKSAEFIFNFTKWCMIILAGVFPLASVFLIWNFRRSCPPPESDVFGAQIVKTGLPVILRLIGIASIFTILNGLMDMRALPLYADKAIYYPNYLIVAAVVPVLAFLAGLSINRFIRRFLLPVIILFILFSCMPLFEDYPRVNIIMSTLISIVHYTAWVVFTTAIVELYSGGFWFYGATIVIFFSVAFAFLSPVIGSFVPHSREYQVLFIIIAALFCMLLAFRWILFPKTPSAARRRLFAESEFEMSNLEDIFKGRGLSKREIDVANLLVREGLGKQEIGERLYITPGTAKIHISNIYQKFDVKTRAEFMALFLNRGVRE
jgi:DNA-binding CsgD family transcriptional regulator